MMKYDSLKTNGEKSLSIPVLDKGVNLNLNKSDISDGQMSECKNIWYKDGFIATRPGLYSDIENLIGADMPYGAEGYEYGIADAEVFIGEEYFRIATASAFVSQSVYFVYIYLVGADRNITNIGNMQFQRTDSETFYIPENITLYAGEKQTGGGIFALVSLVNMHGFDERTYKIYEISEDFSSWSGIEDFYTPTVYINGRGNGYELANQLDIAYTGSPKELEPLNMLDGRFYAYYSSDSYSSSFRLPFSQISEESLFCRIYQNSETYTEWCVYPDTDSQTQSFCGEQVTLKADREKGIITFYVDSSEFAVPQMSGYKENNIRIFAKKEIPLSFEKIVSCRHSIVFNSKIIFSGGIYGSEIYFARYDNPLYFPLINNNTAGSPSNSVTALAAFKNKVIAFKSPGMYSIEISGGKALNNTNLLIDNPAVFYDNADLKISAISDTVGCDIKSTVAKLGKYLIWQAPGGDVCRYSGSSIDILSEPVKPCLSEIEPEQKCCAAAFGRHYLLCFGSKALIMEEKSSVDNAWYIWQFPQDLIVSGIFANKDVPVFICKAKDTDLCFTAGLQGDTDYVAAESDDGISAESVDIESHLKTKDYALGKQGKYFKITNIFLKLFAGGDTYIKAASQSGICSFKIQNADVYYDKEKSVRLIANLKCRESFNICIDTFKPFKFASAEVYSTEING